MGDVATTVLAQRKEETQGKERKPFARVNSNLKYS